VDIWNVEPRVGIGPVRLGMSRREVIAALGEPKRAEPPRRRSGRSVARRDIFFPGSDVEINYVRGRVNFIGVNAPEHMEVRFDDVPIFDVLFRDLARWLSAEHGVDVGERDFPAAWTFPDLGMCLWRSWDESTVDDELRAIGDHAGLFVEQVAVDARFAAPAKRLARAPGPSPPPRPVRAGATPRILWETIAAREAGGESWTAFLTALTRAPLVSGGEVAR
jgi:hypothetical protein